MGTQNSHTETDELESSAPYSITETEPTHVEVGAGDERTLTFHDVEVSAVVGPNALSDGVTVEIERERVPNVRELSVSGFVVFDDWFDEVTEGEMICKQIDVVVVEELIESGEVLETRVCV